MGNKPLSQREYFQIKQHQTEGDTVDKVRRLIGRSWDTINRVYKSDNYGAFRTGQVSATAPKVESATIRELRRHQAELGYQFESMIATLIKLEEVNNAEVPDNN